MASRNGRSRNSKGRKLRFVPPKIKTPKRRAEAIRKATNKVRANASIDFVDSIRRG